MGGEGIGEFEDAAAVGLDVEAAVVRPERPGMIFWGPEVGAGRVVGVAAGAGAGLWIRMRIRIMVRRLGRRMRGSLGAEFGRVYGDSGDGDKAGADGESGQGEGETRGQGASECVDFAEDSWGWGSEIGGFSGRITVFLLSGAAFSGRFTLFAFCAREDGAGAWENGWEFWGGVGNLRTGWRGRHRGRD